MARTTHRHIILDMDSSDSQVHGEQEGAAYSAHDWRKVLEPIVVRYERAWVRRYLRADAAFASPGVYEYLEEHCCLYAIRLPANDILEKEIQHLLRPPVGRPPKKPIVWYHDFLYQAGSCERPRWGGTGGRFSLGWACPGPSRTDRYAARKSSSSRSGTAGGPCPAAGVPTGRDSSPAGGVRRATAAHRNACTRTRVG